MNSIRTLTIPEAIELALQHHRAGRLQDAQDLYQRVLAGEPNNADANHLLGVIAHQLGKDATAIGLIQRAILADPNMAEAHYNLGNALYRLGRLDEAVSSYRNAVALEPNHPLARNNLGTALRDTGRLDEAVASYEAALSVAPEYAEAHYNLGSALKDRGRLEEAVASYRRAIAAKPDYAEAHNNLGAALNDLGHSVEAIASCEKALSCRSDYPEAYCNLGVALKELGRLKEAVASYSRALSIRPDYAEVRSNLGNALKDLGQLDEAVASYHKALAIRPDYAEANYNLGVTLREQGQLQEAIACFRAVLRQDPGDEIYGARLELANLGAERLPERTPDAYLKSLYARKARTWGNASAENYHGHRLITETIERELRRTDLRVLDAGCGTGTLAELLRRYASRLDGVDLSAEMLRKASAQGLYDHLEEVDLLEFLSDKGQEYDLVVAAAVLIHFRDLEPVFRAVRAALRNDGSFVFSLFVSSDREVTINTFKMYAHGISHVERLARKIGFLVKRRTEGVHEYHGQKPVRGVVYLFSRSS